MFCTSNTTAPADSTYAKYQSTGVVPAWYVLQRFSQAAASAAVTDALGT